MMILALSPHSDDSELGCGGLLAQHPDARIYWIAQPVNPPSLLIEQYQSSGAIGVKCHPLLPDVSTRHFSEERQRIADALYFLNKDCRPDLVLCPASTDTHPDHRVVYEETVRIFARSASILGYELPWNHLETKCDAYMELSEADLRLKIEACECYKSQAVRHYFDPKLIESLARLRGAQIDKQYAECYEVIRWRL